MKTAVHREAQTFVDTSQHTGLNREHTSAWSAWAAGRMPAMRILHHAGILGPDNRPWRNVAEHSLVVNATAVLIGTAIFKNGYYVDMDVIDQGSILHDATKRLEKEDGISYASEHASPLRRHFLSLHKVGDDVIAAAEYTGRVGEMFITNQAERVAAIYEQPLEHLVVAYSDARVRNTNIVPLEAARDMNKQKVPADSDVYDQWYSFYRDVENRIFSLTTDPAVTAADISEANVLSMVHQAAA